MKTLLAALTLVLFIATLALAANAEGEKIYRARCQGCHGPDGSRTPPGGQAAVKGQSAADLEAKLRGYQTGAYGGAAKRIMETQAKTMTEDQVKALAAYMAAL